MPRDPGPIFEVPVSGCTGDVPGRIAPNRGTGRRAIRIERRAAAFRDLPACQRTCHNAARDSGRRARARGLLARTGSARRTPGRGRTSSRVTPTARAPGAMPRSRAGGPHRRCSVSSRLRRPPRRAPSVARRAGRRPARAPVRRVRAGGRARARHAGRPRPRRRRPVRLERSSRRPLVERVAGLLRKLVAAGIPIVLIPGASDAPGRASIYHANDVVGLVGDGPGAGSLTILDRRGGRTWSSRRSRARVTRPVPGQRPARRRLADRDRPPRDAAARRRDRGLPGSTTSRSAARTRRRPAGRRT